MLRVNRLFVWFAFPGWMLSALGAWSTAALADSPNRVDPSVIRFCVNQLLYDRTFPDGTPAGERTILDPASAAFACRGVADEEEAKSIRKCVNGLLYDATFSNGNPAGERTILDPASAARACSICKTDF